MAKIWRLLDTSSLSCNSAGCAYIVGISEETNTGDNAGANVVPSEWRLVDLGKSESSSLVGVLDVGEVIVEVVEGGVSTRGLGAGGRSGHCVEAVAMTKDDVD